MKASDRDASKRSASNRMKINGGRIEYTWNLIAISLNMAHMVIKSLQAHSCSILYDFLYRNDTENHRNLGYQEDPLFLSVSC